MASKARRVDWLRRSPESAPQNPNPVDEAHELLEDLSSQEEIAKRAEIDFMQANETRKTSCG
jgi:hypothetical protein